MHCRIGLFAFPEFEAVFGQQRERANRFQVRRLTIGLVEQRRIAKKGRSAQVVVQRLKLEYRLRYSGVSNPANCADSPDVHAADAEALFARVVSFRKIVSVFPATSVQSGGSVSVGRIEVRSGLFGCRSW